MPIHFKRRKFGGGGRLCERYAVPMLEGQGRKQGKLSTLTKKCLFGAIKPPNLPINYPTPKKQKRNRLINKQLRLILVGSQGLEP
jgi:hypothetical protein